MGKGGLSCIFKGKGGLSCIFKGAAAGNFMGKGGLSCIFKGSSAEILCAGRPRGSSVRVGFGTTARHSRVAFAWCRPHMLPSGCAFCCFTFIV